MSNELLLKDFFGGLLYIGMLSLVACTFFRCFLPGYGDFGHSIIAGGCLWGVMRAQGSIIADQIKLTK